MGSLSNLKQELSPPIEMPGSHENRVLIPCLLLVVATLAFYNPIVHNQFIDYDDGSYILENPHVVSGLTWGNVKWAFATIREGNWHPVTWLSHAADCQLFGLNPLGHHYTNLLLHAVNAVLLFLLLQRATGFTWASLAVAALFALHPVNVESVAWAAERKNVLSMLFFLAALHAYDRYARTGSRHLYWAVAVLFALGLMAKAQIVTLPFVLLLWDYWPLQRMNAHTASPAASTPRSFGYLVGEKLPFFFLAAADSVITMRAQRTGAAIRSLAEVSMPVRLENAFVSYVRYIGKMFWPSRLAPLYPRPEHLMPVWQVAGAVALLLLISVLVLRWRERRYLLVGWFWFLGTLVPMIGIITIGELGMADRYAYLPYIGLMVAVVWGVDAVASHWRVSRTGLAGAAFVAVIVLGCLTWQQVGRWHDSETLWRYALRVTERNYVAHGNLGVVLKKEGRSDEAVREFRLAKALHKYPPIQVLSLGYYELQSGHPREAMEEATTVLREYSADPILQATAWAELGQAHLQLRQDDQAAQNVRQALRLNPDDELALVGAGILALRQGQPSIAIDQFLHAVKVQPSDVNVLLLVQAFRRAGRSADADSAWAQVQKISHDPREAQIETAQFLTRVGLEPL